MQNLQAGGLRKTKVAPAFLPEHKVVSVIRNLKTCSGISGRPLSGCKFKKPPPHFPEFRDGGLVIIMVHNNFLDEFLPLSRKLTLDKAEKVIIPYSVTHSRETNGRIDLTESRIDDVGISSRPVVRRCGNIPEWVAVLSPVVESPVQIAWRIISEIYPMQQAGLYQRQGNKTIGITPTRIHTGVEPTLIIVRSLFVTLPR